MKKKKIALGCLVIFLCWFYIPSFANSAQTYWEGVDSIGVATTDEACPLVVTNEDLTFTISSLPRPSFKIEEYSSNVSAKYTFYNPASYDVTATLVFPFGTQPYYFDFYDFATENNIQEKYTITTDGKVLEKNIRYTYGSAYDFNIQRDIQKLKKDYTFDAFWNEDLKIYKCTYKFVGMPATKECCFTYTTKKDEVVLWGNNSYLMDEKSDIETYGFWFNPSNIVDIYFVGEMDDAFETRIKFYEDMGFKKEISGQVELLKKEMKSFYEYAFMFYDEKYGISRVDWYNAIQDMLKEDKIYNEQSFDIRHRVLGWYEYELVVKSKEYVVNEVIAPLFPSFDESYEPTMYTFTYLLSPASTWKDFSNLNIKIVTDAYILNTTLGKVERVEDGTYQFHLDKLPEGEFVFEVSTALNPKKIITGFYVFYMIIEILTILFCISPFGIILLILYFIRRKNSSKEQKKLKRYYGIEASLSILMMIFGFLSLFSYYISGIAATGILCCLGILLCLIVECVKQNRIMFIRIFLTIATLLSYSFCFVDLSTLQENFKMVGMVSIIFGILLYISIIVTLLNLNKQISHQEKTVIKPNEFYPIGYLNGKWKLVLNIFLGIWFSSFSIGLTILLYKEESFLLLFVIYFILFI
ncbi:MAG: hypothetical protein K2P14_08195, partial [Anaeroplasmataceae bacterium]|nr:hypothetical protein [Anaeroplasmataceae bacterium]